jgi:iron complex transport system substrate-binding protein
VRSVVAIVCLAVLLAACAAHSVTGRPESPLRGGRVVTLVPSFAEDLVAVGAVSQLVGVSAFTDVPAIAGLPRVADVSGVDAEAILALHPTLVLGIPAQARFIEPLRRSHLHVVLLADDTYRQIFSNLRAIGALTGHARQAAQGIARLQRVTSELRRRTRRFVRRPSVFVVLGTGPIWTAGSGSYITTLIALAGGRNAADDLHSAYGEYSAEALLRNQPDLLVADRAVRIDAVLGREPWRSLRAVQLHRVDDVNPAIIERPGPNYNAGIRWLVEHLAPLATARHV